ncbi:triphosphoribosyl-dephospho-CoA synthase [Treponema zioleckii]
MVDRHDTGAHRDMDVTTFEKSTAAISPFLAKMYEAGWQSVLKLN